MINKQRVEELIEFIKDEKDFFVQTVGPSFNDCDEEGQEYNKEITSNFNDTLEVLNAVLNEMGGV